MAGVCLLLSISLLVSDEQNRTGRAGMLCYMACLTSFWMVILRRTYRRELLDRQNAENKAKASESLFRGLFENVQEGVYQTSCEGRILAANPAIVKMFGLESELELKSCDVSKDFYYDPEERKRLTSQLERDGFLRNVELNLKRKDGTEIVVVENARAVRDALGRLLYYEGSLFDITDRKKIEGEAREYIRQLELAQRKLELQARLLLDQSLEIAEARDKAVESSRLKSELLASWSRQIAEPLDGVSQMANLLLESELDPQQREFAHTVELSSRRLLETLQEIQDYSGLESGHWQWARDAFSLREIVESVLDRWAELAEGKGLELPCLVRPDVPDRFVGDPARLAQALSNLIENAIQFTDSGEVAITVSLAREDAAEVHLRFEVEDSGCGMEGELVSRLFEPFSRCEPGRQHPGGKALGLAIAKQIVEQMGGEIGAESEPGQGSRIWFLIRLPKDQDSRESGPDLSLFAGKRILIVDDVASCRGTLAELAIGWNLKVSAAADGEEALGMMRAAAESNSPFDFALIDYEMPGMGGLDLAEAMLDDPATSDTNAILVIPHSEKEWKEEPILAGLRGVICKPVKATELLDALLLCPLADRPRAYLAREPETTSDLLPRFLIVEDNHVNQKVAARLVEKMGYHADIAANGLEALQALDRRNYQLILMDCQMPEMDGFAATQSIRNLSTEVSAIPIIAMTANAMQGDRERCLAAGMNDYISKPVGFEDLRAIVTHWLERVEVAAHP